MQGPEDILLASNSTLHHSSGIRRSETRDCISPINGLSRTASPIVRLMTPCAGHFRTTRYSEYPTFLEILLHASTSCRRNTEPCLLRLDMDRILLLPTSILTPSSPTIFSVHFLCRILSTYLHLSVLNYPPFNLSTMPCVVFPKVDDQPKSPFFKKFPPEIRKAIYTELFGSRHVHVLFHSSAYLKPDFSYTTERAPPRRKIPGWAHCVCQQGIKAPPHQHREKNHEWCYLSASIIFTCKHA